MISLNHDVRRYINIETCIKTAYTLTIIIGILSLSNYTSYKNHEQIKYILPYIITAILLTILILASINHKTKNFTILFCAFLPFLVWGGSVIIPTISGEHLPIITILLVFYLILRLINTSHSAPFTGGERSFWILLVTLFLGRALFYVIESSSIDGFRFHVFINWAFSPFLFCLTIFALRARYDIQKTKEILFQGLGFLFISTIIVILSEMVTRGQNLGLNYILHGANGGFSNSEADVTGGHGEPLVLGMSASFGAILALQKKNYKLLALMTLLAFFCMSLRPIIVAISIGATLLLFSKQKNGILKKTTFLILIISVLAIYKDSFSSKFLGTNSTTSTLDIAGGVTLGYNFGYYFKELQWAKSLGLDLAPWAQTLLSPLAGGNEGSPLFSMGLIATPIFLGIMKLAISIFIITYALKRRKLILIPALTTFFILICYLDPFQALYKDNLSEIRLGSVPRESPTYFFIIYITSLFYSLKSNDTDIPIPKSKTLIRAILNR